MENEIQELEIDKRQMNDNYFKNAFFNNFKLNIIIIIISIILFIIEFFYRDPLFKYSLDFEKNWQENATKETITTFKIFTKIGGEYLMAVPVIIVLWFFTLIKSYVYLMGFIFCLQFHSMMKIWYGNKRPFWQDPSLYKGICDGGFGNPSGHSITTSFLYLSLFFYYTQAKVTRDKYKILIIILLFCLFWIVMILLSRIILGMHSVNQIIYGTSLGLIISSFIFIVFKIHQLPVSIYKKFFREKKYKYIILSILCVFIIITISNVFIFNKEFDYDKYNDILDKLCEKKVPKYRRFNLDGLFGSITILALLGMYLGQIVFWYLIENKYKFNEVNYMNNIKQIQEMNINDIKFSNDIKNSKNEIINKNKIETDNLSQDSFDDLINHWNTNRIYICDFKNILKLIAVLIICLLPAILFIAIKNDSDIIIIFIFKLGIPMLLVPFLIYSFGFYFLIKISCGPKETLLKRLQEI
jgi:membrane-associated phospholipid phosphatase